MRKTALCLALLAGLPMASQARTLGSLTFTPCTLTAPQAAASVEAQCTTLDVPENHAAPDGRRIALALAWVPATDEAEADPVFMLAGGPGQSARETFPGIAPAFAETRRKRHVLLLDQRGTGESNRLACRDTEGRSAVTDEATPEAGQAFAERCRDELLARADLRFYTTTDAVADLDAVRAAIGAEKINLVGISYGTRVAQQYARRHPAHTRALVLDGVVPNTLVLGNEHARNLEAALDLHFARCAEGTTCHARFGPPRELLTGLLRRLGEASVPVSYRDPNTGELRDEDYTRGHLAGLVRLYSYIPMAAAMLPLLLHEAEQGQLAPLAAQTRLISRQMSEQIMHGMQLSVMCTEDAAGFAEDAAAEGSVLGGEFVDFARAQCAVWPSGDKPADFNQPLTGDVPALLLSGEFDPVTPPRYGDAVAATLPNARHLVLRGQGHNVIPVGCTPRLMARFLDTADAISLDAACLDTLPYTPPFAGYYGWEP